jgi:hypothetical protein
MTISERDLKHLIEIHLRNPDEGYSTNGEVAEMYGVPAEDVDALVLGTIYSENEIDDLY